MSDKKSWLMGINEAPVYVVREDGRRWAVWTNAVEPPKGDRWGHFRTMRDAMQFARDVVNRRAFYSDVANLMVLDPAHRGSV
jgi:uncharacterized protein YbdZ (MbtH family)